MNVVALGEVVECLDRHRVPVTESERVAGPVPYYGANGQQGWIDRPIFDEPLVIVAEDGGHFGEPKRGVAYRIAGPSWVNNHGHVLRARPGVDHDYLFHVLRNYNFAPYISGSTRSKLTQKQLMQVEIPLPPLDEQRRIAAILDQADALRAKRRVILTHFDDLMQAAFDEMFARQEWPTQRLDAITDPDDRMNYGIVQPDVEVPDGIPMIRVTDLVDGKVVRSALKKVAPGVDAKHRRSRIRGTEVLVSSVGTLGRIAVTSEADVGSNVNRAIVRVPISDPILRRYVAGYLQTAVPQRYFRREARTVAQATLNVREVASLQIPLPSRDLQAKFVEVYEELVGRKATASAAERLQGDLFASLQSRAFQGKL